MKFSARQILASAVGAVLAALIASSFGVKGTIIGVAIGSVVATMGTAIVGQSIERGHEAVKQVVVRAPDSTLLRRLGGTGTSGQPDSTLQTGRVSAADSPPATSGSGAAVADVAGTEPPGGVTGQTEGAVGSEEGAAGGPARRYSWQVIAGTAGVVFLLALLFVTAVELTTGEPLSAIFGDHGTGPSVKDIFVPSPAPATTTTTSTTVPSTTSTTGPTASSTTVSTTTTTAAGGGTTTTTGAGGTGSTTTTAAGGTTTSSVPG